MPRISSGNRGLAKKNSHYVVWRGRQTGIFDSWDDCRRHTSGYDGAQFKGYPTREEAEAAFKKNYWQAVSGVPKVRTEAAEIVTPSIAVDAACSGNPGLMEYRGVWTATGQEIFRIGPLEQGTNNVGEFLALVHGLALLKQQNSPIPIYTDSVNAMAWVRNKKCKTRLERTLKNAPIFDLIARAEAWLANNRYTTQIIKWDTVAWGEIPADFGRK